MHQPSTSATNTSDVFSSNQKSVFKIEVDDSEFPIPPAGFLKKFHTSPNPLPITEDGFLNPNTKAFFMNIIGKCRLCNASMSSHLVDLHLLECLGIDQQMINNFVKYVTNHTPLKNKDIASAKKYTGFKLQDNKIPNKIFKKKHYKLFTLKLEELTKLLTENAFKSLSLPVSIQNFNLLKYTN